MINVHVLRYFYHSRSLCSSGVRFEFGVMDGEEGSVVRGKLERVDERDKGLDCISTHSGGGTHHYEGLQDTKLFENTQMHYVTH